MLERLRYQYVALQEMGSIPVSDVSTMSENETGMEFNKRQIFFMPSCGTKESNNLVDLYGIEVSAIMMVLEFDVSKLAQERKRALVARLANAFRSILTHWKLYVLPVRHLSFLDSYEI